MPVHSAGVVSHFQLLFDDYPPAGIRPQDDNPDAALYPEIVAHIEATVNKTGKKVVIKGSSGGTINSYAFIMHQPLEWRKKHIMAWIPMSPVFGGTISSLLSILEGWNVRRYLPAGRPFTCLPCVPQISAWCTWHPSSRAVQ